MIAIKTRSSSITVTSLASNGLVHIMSLCRQVVTVCYANWFI